MDKLIKAYDRIAEIEISRYQKNINTLKKQTEIIKSKNTRNYNLTLENFLPRLQISNHIIQIMKN